MLLATSEVGVGKDGVDMAEANPAGEVSARCHRGWRPAVLKVETIRIESSRRTSPPGRRQFGA
jgi:hypothetical protein